MKLMQANIWVGKLGKPIVDLINEESPDIICFQEAASYKTSPGAIFTSIEEISAKTIYPFIYMSPVFSFKFMRNKVKFGNAILSRLKFNQKETIFTNKAHVENFDFEHDDYNVRNFQHVVINVDNKKLHIINHHGYHIKEHKNGNDQTVKAIKQIIEYASKLSGPIIICGDFNLTPDSKSLRPFNDVFTNLSAKYGLKTTRNEFKAQQEVCDYIFVNDQVKVKNFHMPKKIISDHQALILEFGL